MRIRGKMKSNKVLDSWVCCEYSYGLYTHGIYHKIMFCRKYSHYGREVGT